MPYKQGPCQAGRPQSGDRNTVQNNGRPEKGVTRLVNENELGIRQHGYRENDIMQNPGNHNMSRQKLKHVVP